MIVIRISDAAQEVRVREVIEEEFKFLEQRMNSERDPLLKDAIMQDRRWVQDGLEIMFKMG